MSASPVARQATQSQTIPSRRILINDSSQLPVDYSTTPGGTLYSTTPGGTRIVYERATLLHLRNSPIARTPPKHLPNIPDILLKSSPDSIHEPKENGSTISSPIKKEPVVDESSEQFQMDM
ncbi:eukaryotic translation initiation factor 4E binding protein thor [Lycorma delicatula]|uniref:eukaryotic translation initiation factor 4E binding protein thor n=1 Tax=Lycorma delicatula TaxID=130591 RepID=UPI003F512DBB